jgi:hypothetical protein
LTYSLRGFASRDFTQSKALSAAGARKELHSEVHHRHTAMYILRLGVFFAALREIFCVKSSYFPAPSRQNFHCIWGFTQSRKSAFGRRQDAIKNSDLFALSWRLRVKSSYFPAFA